MKTQVGRYLSMDGGGGNSPAVCTVPVTGFLVHIALSLRTTTIGLASDRFGVLVSRNGTVPSSLGVAPLSLPDDIWANIEIQAIAGLNQVQIPCRIFVHAGDKIYFHQGIQNGTSTYYATCNLLFEYE